MVRFELTSSHKSLLPLKLPDGDFILYSPSFISIYPAASCVLDLGLAAISDDNEGFYLKTYPDLFLKQHVSIITYKITELKTIHLVLFNLTTPREPTNSFDSIQRQVSTIAPKDPVAILSPYLKK